HAFGDADDKDGVPMLERPVRTSGTMRTGPVRLLADGNRLECSVVVLRAGLLPQVATHPCCLSSNFLPG
ncbi:hypothetical protein ACWGJX_47375, partial [Streptomyces sp. NPDC054775]